MAVIKAKPTSAGRRFVVRGGREGGDWGDEGGHAWLCDEGQPLRRVCWREAAFLYGGACVDVRRAVTRVDGVSGAAPKITSRLVPYSTLVS